MNSFETLISEFCEKTGLELQSGKDGSVDLVVDGLDVNVQYRQDKDDCALFTLPIHDTEPEPCMMRRALELAANGVGTGGHFLGIKEGMFVLSSVVKMEGLSAEDFAERLISLANMTRHVAESLASAVAENVAQHEEKEDADAVPTAGDMDGTSPGFAIRV